MTDPMPRQDLTLPPPIGYVSRADYDALLARLEDAEAAQALVVEQAAELCASTARAAEDTGNISREACARGLYDAIRALAAPSGVEALAALRAERDRINQWRETAIVERDTYSEERDDALTRLAAAEARVAALTDYDPEDWPGLSVPNRSQQFIDGAHWGIRKCIAWLHARAGEMRDPDGKARDILNATATNIGMWKGWHLRNRKARAALASAQGVVLAVSAPSSAEDHRAALATATPPADTTEGRT